MTPSPWAFHAHVGGWSAVLVVSGCYLAMVTRLEPGDGPTRKQWWEFGWALAALAAALTWPVADLAAHWSLTALLVQRLLLTLAVAPLLLLALPLPALARLTRPWPVDTLVDFLSRPQAAVVVFSVLVVGTLTSPAVATQAASGWWRGCFDVLLVGAGAVLWVPALGRVPGTRRMSPVGRAVYLVVQSVLPNFPAVVFVFSRHPLYAAFAHAHRAIGLSALNDQQLAGIVAKVGTLPVLWTAAWRALSRAERAERLGFDDEPLTWVEVARALERSERAERRAGGATSG
jgi:putative membrane protein